MGFRKGLVLVQGSNILLIEAEGSILIAYVAYYWPRGTKPVLVQGSKPVLVQGFQTSIGPGFQTSIGPGVPNQYWPRVPNQYWPRVPQWYCGRVNTIGSGFPVHVHVYVTHGSFFVHEISSVTFTNSLSILSVSLFLLLYLHVQYCMYMG